MTADPATNPGGSAHRTDAAPEPPDTAGRQPASDPRAHPVEVELKYRPTTLAAGERVLNAASIAGFAPARAPRTVRFEDRYLDTAAGALVAAGFAARLRTTPAGTIVSLKGTARRGTGEVHRRAELEGPADPVAPPREWPESDARALVLEVCGDEPLVELLTLRQVRHRRRLRDDGTVLEVSLDEVEVVAGGDAIDRWIELEIELVRGDEERLMAVAAELERDPALRPGRTSKLEAALASLAARGTAAAPSAGQPVKAAVPKSPGVTGEDTVAEAGRKTLRFHLARMLAREAGTRAGTNLEDLHAMRVATRRMRAAWRIFGSGFEPARTRKLQRRLRAVARRLGDVRDLDVQLDSDAYARFVEELRQFVDTEGAGAVAVRPTDPNHVRDTAPSRIWAAYEQVRAYEPVLRWADVPTLHELRIAAKWLRYSLEFVREPLGPEVEVLVPRVTALQDHLGWLHDAEVAADRARAFLVDHAGSVGPVESAAIGRYLVSRERELGRLRRTVGPAWRGVAGLSFRRRLGRAVAGL